MADLILNITNNIDGKFIFSENNLNSENKKLFIGVEFYKENKLILKLFNN